MQRAIAVALAGAVGTLLRYAIARGAGALDFPWATLGINVLGSFALGYVLGHEDGRWDATAQVAITIGFLGAFTTFSTFSFEAASLLRADRAAAAFTYVAASVVVGLAASAVGYVLARSG